MRISTVIENHDSKLQKIIDSQRKFQNSGVPLEKDFRRAALTTLRTMVSENEEKLLQALKDDLSKSESEAFITEISIVYQEIDYALKNLNKWMKPRTVPPTSAFESIMQGHWPPSSRLTGVKCLAAFTMTFLAASVLPVKNI